MRLFERVIGSKLRWGVIRDSDANIPAVKAKHRELAASIGIPVFHQWALYSIENYLLNPVLLAAAANKKKTNNAIDEDSIRTLLEKAVLQIEGEVTGSFVTKTQNAYRVFQMSDKPYDDGARDATNYLLGLKDAKDKLAVYPGKRIFGALVELLQANYGLNLRLEEVIAELTPENAPTELKECPALMQRFESRPGLLGLGAI